MMNFVKKEKMVEYRFSKYLFLISKLSLVLVHE